MKLGELSTRQKQFGNHNFAPRNKYGRANTPERIKTVLYMAGDQVTLKNFDTSPNRLAEMIRIGEEGGVKADLSWIIQLRRFLERGEPTDNFWEFIIMSLPKDRVKTLEKKLKRMNYWLTKTGYYSPSFRETIRKYGVCITRNQDGIRKENLIFNENEIAIISSATIPHWKTGGDAYMMQSALDMMTMAIWYGARRNDIRTIIKSTDSSGKDVAVLNNHKSTRVQSIAWHPATDAAFNRGLYTQVPTAEHDRMLRLALKKILPQASDRLVKYTVYRPASGRIQLNDYRLSHIGFHCGRHTAATRWLRMGVNLNTVSKLLGHANVMITAKYYDWMTEDENNTVLREAYYGGQQEAPIIPAKKAFGQRVEIPKINKIKSQLPEPEPGNNDPVVTIKTSETKEFKRKRMLEVIRKINEEDGTNLRYK